MEKIGVCEFCNEEIDPGLMGPEDVYEDEDGNLWHIECYEEEFGEKPPPLNHDGSG